MFLFSCDNSLLSDSLGFFFSYAPNNWCRFIQTLKNQSKIVVAVNVHTSILKCGEMNSSKDTSLHIKFIQFISFKIANILNLTFGFQFKELQKRILKIMCNIILDFHQHLFNKFQPFFFSSSYHKTTVVEITFFFFQSLMIQTVISVVI